jgi:hypothetical protein
MGLYLDELDQRLTADERARLLVALEQPKAAHALAHLRGDLAVKTERLVEFVTNNAAPQQMLIRSAATHLRHAELGPLNVP